jgi:hypothetical protein
VLSDPTLPDRNPRDVSVPLKLIFLDYSFVLNINDKNHLVLT